MRGQRMTDELTANQSVGAINYRRGIRAASRAYWLSAFDYDQFYDALDTVIRNGIPKAAYEGARQCGIQPNELSPQERQEIEKAIMSERSHIDGFATVIENHLKKDKGKWGTVSARAEAWVNRYEQVRQKIMAMACKDQKSRWVLGEAEHCPSCLKLSGKVKRNSYWTRTGILPRVPGADYLECRGYLCQCMLEPTDDPLSKGPLPKLP